MSYARWGTESDVYAYAEIGEGGRPGRFVCSGCAWFFSAAGLLAHLQEHRKRGDKVPQGALDRLVGEVLIGGAT